MINNEKELIAAVKRNAEKIGASARFVSIFTQGFKEDPYCAMQLGLAVLMDKPIHLVIPEEYGDIKIPENLRNVAESINYCDMTNPVAVNAVIEIITKDLK